MREKILEELYKIPNGNVHYIKRYVNFILSDNIKVDNKLFYGESHHILPRCLFPEYKSKNAAAWNQRRISARAHYIAHWILFKAFPNNWGLVKAFLMMCNMSNCQVKIKINSKAYQDVKSKHSLNMKEWHKGDESKQRYENISKGQRKGFQDNPERKLVLSESAKRRNADPEYSAKVKEINKRVANTPEGKLQRSINAKKILIRPWFHPKIKTLDRSRDIWLTADKAYDVWTKNKPGYHVLGQLFNLPINQTKRYGCVIRYFKKYGDPRNDTLWIEWKSSFNHDDLL